MKCALFALLLFLAACGSATPVAQESGPLDATAEPVQSSPGDAPEIERTVDGEKFTIKPMARYRLVARVVSRERYHTGWQSALAPVDLALAWGRLATGECDDFITYSQGNRWYYYRFKGGCPVSRDYIVAHSANHHIIPATVNIDRAVKNLSVGDVIGLEGYLVRVDGKSGAHDVWWTSSLSREDEGDGSCEVFYVDKLRKGNDVYR